MLTSKTMCFAGKYHSTPNSTQLNMLSCVELRDGPSWGLAGGPPPSQSHPLSNHTNQTHHTANHDNHEQPLTGTMHLHIAPSSPPFLIVYAGLPAGWLACLLAYSKDFSLVLKIVFKNNCMLVCMNREGESLLGVHAHAHIHACTESADSK